MLLKPLDQKLALYYASIWDKELEVIQEYEQARIEGETERWWFALAVCDCLPIEYLIDVEMTDA
jgi:hypothetical protein